MYCMVEFDDNLLQEEGVKKLKNWQWAEVFLSQTSDPSLKLKTTYQEQGHFNSIEKQKIDINQEVSVVVLSLYVRVSSFSRSLFMNN
jgi:predicted ATP-binding protein involved in virulence